MTRHFIPLLAAVLFLGAAFAASAASQAKTPDQGNSLPSTETTSTQTLQPIQMSQPDLLYMIHSINELEVHAGRLAEMHSNSYRVRAYGRRLVIDHSAADRRLMHLAENNHVILAPPQASSLQQQQQMQQTAATMQQLETLRGPAFDKVFLQFMQQGHHQAIQMLAENDKAMLGSPLKSMVNNLIPILTQHYEIASILDIHQTAQGLAGGY